MNSVMALMSQPSKVTSLFSTVSKEGAKDFQKLLSAVQSDGEGGDMALLVSEDKVKQLLNEIKKLLEEAGIDLKSLFPDLEEGVSFDQLFAKIEANLTSEERPVNEKGLEQLKELVNILQESPVDLPNQTVQKAEELAATIAALVTAAPFEPKPVSKPMDQQRIEVTAKPGNIEANQHQTEKHLHNLWQKFQQLTHRVTTGEEKGIQMDPKTAIEVKQVLQELNKLLKQQPNQGKELLNQMMKQGTETEKQLFKDLFQSFQKRQNLPQSYHQQVPVKGKDIVKWVSQSLETQQANDGTQKAPITQGGGVQPQMTMSKVEQFVVHVNQNQSQGAKQQEFIQQFERILQSSKLFSNRAGGMEMQLKLKPHNLGDMMVRMVQVNGEMAVKILVSSQAAKEMLDGNMNQLRHMFSPQQVIVERQENLQAQQSFFQDAELNEDDQQQQNRQSAGEGDSGEDNGEEEELSFHDVLMNEKV
ncbi:flagellar hook-length control protein FliK [Halobacillus litoralis]|uniref:flagellar hook-length control protein FliK n=1 Tax=Halobacillus litoralis TaxID=45668 RepID=UPI001CD77DFB|nr:flagellar hook-length control protein FliK [Halobacillus litoralis]MCA0969138.1 flagellar hook-length control protein FliK [Halobacillus litoralis]